MKIQVTEQESIITVELIGELDTPGSVEIQPVIDDLLTKCDHDITVDCSQLSYIASAGLRQLLSIRKATRTSGKHLVLTNISPSISTVLHVTNLDRLLEIR